VSATYVRGRIAGAIDGAPSEVRRFVFDCEGVTGIDVSGLDVLGRLLDDRERSGIALEQARIRHDLVDRSDNSRTHRERVTAAGQRMRPRGRLEISSTSDRRAGTIV